jgi:hypothetical protein
MKKILICAAVLLSLTGCASVPTDPAQQARYYAEQSGAELAKGDLVNAFWDMNKAIHRPGGAEHMRAAIANPALHTKMIEAINTQVSSSLSIDSAVRMNGILDNVASAKLLSDSELESVRTKFADYLHRGNETGAIAFTITPEVVAMPQLAEPQQMKIIYQRTIRAYQDRTYSARDMQAVIKYVQSNPQLISEFKAALPTMSVRASELDYVALIDPSFANNRKAQLSMRAHLSVKNADRLFADDVVSKLNQDIHGVTWLQSEQPGAVELVVERIRDAEKVLPAESRTVTYSQYQVDILAAALLMPKNASYQFDLKKGGAELEYGYVITASKNGVKLAEKVLRGKLGGSYTKCENARIVNVFGGVTSAGFMANNDMKSACTGATEVSMDALRAELLGKISNEVVAMPEISEVHSMNL